MNEQYIAPMAEKDPTPRDVSQEFLTMHHSDFKGFVRGLGREVPLIIEIDWVDVGTARRCKAFMDDFSIKNPKTVKIRATEEQYREDVNAFESGVKLIKA